MRHLSLQIISIVSGRDFYQVLGVHKNSTVEDIRQAYQEKAVTWHPSQHPLELKAEATRFFDEIGQAYQILGDSEERKIYDSRPDYQPSRPYKNAFEVYRGLNLTEEWSPIPIAEASLADLSYEDFLPKLQSSREPFLLFYYTLDTCVSCQKVGIVRVLDRN